MDKRSKAGHARSIDPNQGGCSRQRRRRHAGAGHVGYFGNNRIIDVGTAVLCCARLARQATGYCFGPDQYFRCRLVRHTALRRRRPASKRGGGSSPSSRNSSRRDQATALEVRVRLRSCVSTHMDYLPFFSLLNRYESRYINLDRIRAFGTQQARSLAYRCGTVYGTRASRSRRQTKMGQHIQQSTSFLIILSHLYCHRELYVWGYIPVVVAKWSVTLSVSKRSLIFLSLPQWPLSQGNRSVYPSHPKRASVFLGYPSAIYLHPAHTHLFQSTGTEVEGIFRINGSTKRMRELQTIFETPPRYGKNIQWQEHAFTPHDVASIFRRFLTYMPVSDLFLYLHPVPVSGFRVPPCNPCSWIFPFHLHLLFVSNETSWSKLPLVSQKRRWPYPFIPVVHSTPTPTLLRCPAFAQLYTFANPIHDHSRRIPLMPTHSFTKHN